MALYYDVTQGSPEWFELRLGIPTASEFKKIITPKTLKMSSQAEDYAEEKIAEFMLGESQGLQVPTYHMERGSLLEFEAAEAYEFTHEVQTRSGGFVTDDKGHFGASPDRFVGEDGCLEIKCLMPKNHIKYLLAQCVDPDHMPQVQGQMLIAEKQWCDWWMYHPDLPRVAIRTYRDDEYIHKLQNALFDFREMMERKIKTLIEQGHIDFKEIEKRAENRRKRNKAPKLIVSPYGG